ncbi:MAG: hypothetical protein ISR82_07945 [Candidatus Marinimicrobia bacterium]|nr:hypothetical protein [Candidatus Neomarinimicrobiota bacterium]MBL7011140.1 hypothetical protein [Candidatus Neomarinimicrobiota bacterium]MBL7031296.1 hypothetical protein [Candidatus Neomarinimicrobiota bacterium]
MRRNSHLRSIIFILFFSFPQSQSASEAIHFLEDEIGYGARSLAMGGAFTALGNDPSGMYWNPAGLAGMTNGVIYFEGQNLSYTNLTTYMNESTLNPLNLERLNGLGIAVPIPTIRGSLVVGLGFNRIVHYDSFMSFSGFSNVDNELSFPIELDGIEQLYNFSNHVNRSETILSVGSMEMVTLSFGIALSPTISGGLSFSRVTGQETYSFEFSQEDSQNQYTQFPADFKQYDLKQTLAAKTRALNIRSGLQFLITEALRVGVAISLPFKINISENHSTDEILSFDNGDKSDARETGLYTYKVNTPMVLDMGAALTMGNLAVAGSFRYRDWGMTQFNLDNYGHNSDAYIALRDENTTIALKYRPVFQMRGGMEYLMEINKSFGFTLRAGLAFYPSPKGELPEDRMVISFGAGIPLGKNMMMDGALISTSWLKNSSDMYTPFGTTEKVQTDRILLNISYLF